MNTGKCPHCSAVLEKILVEDISLNDDKQPRWRGFSYLCPSCKAVLSVQMNPLALNFDLLTEIKKPAVAPAPAK